MPMPDFPSLFRPPIRRRGSERLRQGDEIVVFKNNVPAEVDMPEPSVWGDKAIPESPAPHEKYGIENVDLPDPEVWGRSELHDLQDARRAELAEEALAQEPDE